MPRNAEVIRQWSILRDLESSRRLTIDEMASRTGVTTRTIRRDLEALQEAGFPLFDEVHDGKRYWTLEQRAFRRLDDTGFNLAELSALYFSRTLAECLAATPFQQDVRNAFDKLAAALTPGMRQFLDRLPLAIQAKADPGARVADAGRRTTTERRSPIRAWRSCSTPRCTIGASRCATTRSRATATKRYAVEPQRLVFAQGGLYLLAFVPEYDELRTFSVDRILGLSLTEERFEPKELSEDAFAHSLGVHQGTPERVEIAFEPRMARYVRERIWHPSQQMREERTAAWSQRWTSRTTGRCEAGSWDSAPLARVFAPAELAAQILRRSRAHTIALRAVRRSEIAPRLPGKLLALSGLHRHRNSDRPTILRSHVPFRPPPGPATVTIVRFPGRSVTLRFAPSVLRVLFARPQARWRFS